MKTPNCFTKIVKTLLAASAFIASVSWAGLDLNQEIASLNRDYNGALGYPIFIINKTEFQQFLASKNVAGTDNRGLLGQGLAIFIKIKFHIELQPDEAMALAPFFAPTFKEASAQPFFVDRERVSPMKYCVVIPADDNISAMDEVKRITGADDHPELFQNVDFEKLKALMTQEELQLFSLYHELSHCLDRNYIWSINEFEVVPHNVHKVEAFAETNALLMLEQRKGLRSLGSARSILRTLYSKHYGPALAQSDTNVFAGAVNRAGGSVYFLSSVLLAAQNQIDVRPDEIKKMTLEETLQLSKDIVENHALNKASFDALNMMMKDGESSTLPFYQRMAGKKPSKFLNTYLDLLYFKSLMDGVDKLFVF